MTAHRHCRRRQQQRPAALLRRELRRARDLDDLEETMRLVEHAHLVGHLDHVERVELLALHRRLWCALKAQRPPELALRRSPRVLTRQWTVLRQEFGPRAR